MRGGRNCANSIHSKCLHSLECTFIFDNTLSRLQVCIYISYCIWVDGKYMSI